MRCPYCGVSNAEQARYCAHCGRDMSTTVRTPTARQQPPSSQSPTGQRPPSSSGSSGQQPPPYQPVRPEQGTQGRTASPVSPPQPQPPQSAARARPQPIPAPAPVPQPDPPAPFPPKNVEQLKALEEGALTYSVMDTTTNAGWKKTVRIVFPRCAQWQQVATLLKALKELRDSDHETVVIQGLHSQSGDVYGFTNGQLTFDRQARLGSQTMTRYLVETNDGFSTDALRIILSE